MAIKQQLKKDLIVRLAENQLEIEKALTLRYNVFNQELGEGLPISAQTGKDRDDYDLFCDHLIVLDKKQDSIVGTYRLLRRSVARANIGFYSETEFDLRPVYELEDEVAEIGRSCVHPEYRDGSVILLLWTGLASYMLQYNLRYLMGCGSIHSIDSDTASKIHYYLKEKDALVRCDLDIKPHASHKMDGFSTGFSADIKSITKSVPPLIKGYVRVGARMCSEPAVDRAFGTTDFFVFFDINEVNRRYDDHYGI